MKKKTGGMLKVRIRELRKNQRIVEKLLARKPRDRINTAINSTWTLKEESQTAPLITELSCLRAEIVAITIRDDGEKKASVLSEKLKQIKSINKKLAERQIQC